MSVDPAWCISCAATIVAHEAGAICPCKTALSVAHVALRRVRLDGLDKVIAGFCPAHRAEFDRDQKQLERAAAARRPS